MQSEVPLKHDESYGASPSLMYWRIIGVSRTNPLDTASEATRVARKNILPPAKPQEIVLPVRPYVSREVLRLMKNKAGTPLERARRIDIKDFKNLNGPNAFPPSAADMGADTASVATARSEPRSEPALESEEAQSTQGSTATFSTAEEKPVPQPNPRARGAAASHAGHKRKVVEMEKLKLQECFDRLNAAQIDHDNEIHNIITRDAPVISNDTIARGLFMMATPQQVQAGDRARALDAVSEVGRVSTKSGSGFSSRRTLSTMDTEQREEFARRASIRPASRPAAIHHAMSAVTRILTKQHAAMVIARKPCLSWDRRQHGLMVPQEGYPHVWGVLYTDFVDMLRNFVHPTFKNRAEECTRTAIRTMAHMWNLEAGEAENYLCVEAYNKTEIESEPSDMTRVRKVVIIPIDIVLYIFVYMPPLFSKVDWLRANISMLGSINKWRGAAKLKDTYLADVESSVLSMISSIDSAVNDLTTVKDYAFTTLPIIRDLEVKVQQLIEDNQQLRMMMSVGRMDEAKRQKTETPYERREEIPHYDPPDVTKAIKTSSIINALMTQLRENSK